MSINQQSIVSCLGRNLMAIGFYIEFINEISAYHHFMNCNPASGDVYSI